MFYRGGNFCLLYGTSYPTPDFRFFYFQSFQDSTPSAQDPPLRWQGVKSVPPIEICLKVHTSDAT